MKSRFRALVFLSLVVCFGTPAAYAICPDTDCDPNASEFLVREDCNGRADCSFRRLVEGLDLFYGAEG